MMKKALSIIALMIVMTMTLCACGEKANDSKSDSQTTPKMATTAPKATLDPSLTQNTVKAVIKLEDGRKINMELYPDLAPETVANFEKLANENFYNGLIFHRVIDGFMIQGGGYDKNLKEKEGAETIKGEFTQNGFENNLSHERGVVSMARTNIPDSASSQFFIVQSDSAYLDGQYAAFGKVTDEESMKIVDEIAKTETETDSTTGMLDIPAEPIVISNITIEK